MAYQPKSYKKFVATAATATLVASAIAPVASAAFSDVAEQYKTAVDYLSTKGISQGYPNGKFGTDDKIKRQDAAVMIAKALGASPTGTYANAGFTDVPKDRQWAVNFLVEKKIVSGKTAEKFGANDFTTRGEMSKIIANAYKFVGDATNTFPFTDVSDTFKQYVDALNEAGVAKGLTATKFGTGENVTRGQFALFVYRAETFAPAAPSVVSVSAINGKEIVVDFNGPLDKVTAETAANYELSVNGIAETGFTAKLADSKKQVVLTLTDAAKLANNEALTLTVSKNVLNEKLVAGVADYSKTWVFSDKVAPKVTKVEKDGDNIEVTFDEYVSSTVTISKVNGVDKVVAPVVGLTKTITITDGAKGLANGNYEVLLSGVTDATGNTSSVLTGTVTVSDDTLAPTVSKVEQITDDKLRVTFSKNVSGATFTVKKNGYNLTAVATPAAGPEDEYVITLSDAGAIKVYDAGQSSSVVTLEVTGYKGSTNNLFGAAYTTNVSLNKDTTAPTNVTRFNEIVDIDTAAATFDEVFNIKFNEELTVGSADASKITLTDKDGVRQAVTSATVVNDAAGKPTILQVKSTAIQDATTKKINVGTYTINLGVGSAKDLAANSNAATNVTISKSGTASDVTATATAAANVITVVYGSDMTTTAVSAANYLLNGKALPAGTNIFFDTNKYTVDIELPDGSVSSSGTGVLSISDNVVSTGGSKVASADRTKNITTGFVDNVKPVLASAKKESTTSVELTFSENVDATTLLAADLNDFVVKINGNTVAYTAVVDGVVGDNKISLTVPTYNTSQAVTVSVTGTAADIQLEDIQGNLVTKSTTVTAN
ncbi:hypothetical protein HMPREF1210_01576 [Paenisporosarcina sp. HGH0030]|uniref:S-layer homology domain-containing protein n=1 Tax=Paenisporosarcina sp. HGH0030 TaxID=1078085 RepID=UPI00034ECE6D|nr:S-layer homology domain-containing protein [Paenisporosarcina sp. HGH0030]EPD52223.1 hypothetical protein HMPREF1210_01576 [Paenisporosarcina sp. HGH0030]